MRLALLVCVLVVASSSASLARADAYAWGGHLGRVSVGVSLSGFNDGAGTDGWRLENARWFATWAVRANAVLPAGVRLEITSDEASEELVARLVSAQSTETLPLAVDRAFPGDLDAVLPRLAARFGRSVPPEPPAAPLYTVQVLAAAHPEHADALARRIDRSLSGGSDDFFFEACLPCATRTAHVLAPDARGIRRVVVGVHADRASARRALRGIRDAGLDGYVRAL